MNNEDIHLWDGEGEDAEDAFDLKYEEWEQRDWMTWLAENLVFPFKVTRQEDMDDVDSHRGPQEAASKSATPWRLWGWMGKMK